MIYFQLNYLYVKENDNNLVYREFEQDEWNGMMVLVDIMYL